MRVRSWVGGSVVSMALLAACGGDDSGSPTTGAKGDAGTVLGTSDAGTSSGTGNDASTGGGAGNDAGVSTNKDAGTTTTFPGQIDVCKLTTMAHLSAVFKTTPMVMTGLQECDFAPMTWDEGSVDDVTQATYAKDDLTQGTFSLWTLLGPSSDLENDGDYHPYPGVGDEAYWFDLSGEAVPSFIAKRGNDVCLVQTGSMDYAATYNLTFTGTPPVIMVAEADAMTFAKYLADICTDFFANTK